MGSGDGAEIGMTVRKRGSEYERIILNAFLRHPNMPKETLRALSR